MIKLGEDIQSNIVGSDIEGNLIKSYSNKQFDDNKILCRHCLRTRNNGIRCLGICVEDNEC